MNVDLKLLTCGNCEELKLGVHGTALALAAVMCAYNAAAWLLRREKHLAINTALYSALTAWEVHHVAHHWSVMANRRELAAPGAAPRVGKAAA
jgi:hypothetical protein